MKPSHARHPAQCPFCKSSFYAVEYHGARIEEEKSLEQAEEQKVIEAKIRMRSESPIEESLMPANQSQTLLELLHPFPVVEGPSSEQGEESEIAQVQMYRQQETIDGDGSSYPNMFPTRFIAAKNR